MTVSPGSTPGDDPRGHLLASDVEREATVERLRVAVADGRLTMDELSDRSDIAYRARTTAELSALTRDLPAEHVGPTQAPVASGSSHESESYVAVFSGTERKGHWRVPRRAKVVAVFGGIDLDMRSAELTAMETHITVAAVFSGVEIVVPEGVEVRMSGLAIFGGKSVKVPPAPPGSPVIRISCTAIFAGVEVKSAGQGAPVSEGGERPRPPGPPPPPPLP